MRLDEDTESVLGDTQYTEPHLYASSLLLQTSRRAQPHTTKFPLRPYVHQRLKLTISEILRPGGVITGTMWPPGYER